MADNSKPALSPIKLASQPEITPKNTPVITPPGALPPERTLSPQEAMELQKRKIALEIQRMQALGALPQAPIKIIAGDRPQVREITAKVWMSKATALQIFPQIVFAEGEDHVILTEVLRPAQPGEPIAVVHGASGQKFAVDHYELDGTPL